MAKVATFWIPALNEPTLSLSNQANFAGGRKGVVLCEEKI
jgi:hypothetical protein